MRVGKFCLLSGSLRTLTGKSHLPGFYNMLLGASVALSWPDTTGAIFQNMLSENFTENFRVFKYILYIKVKHVYN